MQEVLQKLDYRQLETVAEIVQQAHRKGVSDIHFSVDKPPLFRLHGQLIPFDGVAPFTNVDSEKLAGALGVMGSAIADHYTVRGLEDALANKYQDTGSGDFSADMPGTEIRIRINMARALGRRVWCMRLIPKHIPSPSELGIPPVVEEIANHNWGLVLVTGPRGSGKSTTLASILNKMNMNQDKKIVIIEDAIEFVHSSEGKSLVEQREVPQDSVTYEQALRDVLRQDADIVQIGEIRTPQVLEHTLSLAESGCLVFATFHSPRALVALDRVVHMLPPDQAEQVRVQLFHVLRGIVAQKLYQQTAGDGSDKVVGRTLVCEILSAKYDEVQKRIRAWDTAGLMKIMQDGEHDCCSLSRATGEVYMRGVELKKGAEKDADVMFVD